MLNKQKKIGILTSGGDAPGMNAAIRAVVRTSEYFGYKTIGFKKGYDGLINGDLTEMNARTVAETIHRGGTILLTARSPELLIEAGQKKAANIYNALGLEALIVIGGDGSLRGANALSKFGVNTIGIPGTIDLDLGFTDYTIGFDTAVNTAMEAINKIRDTSSSHERCSVVEVMGRNAGHIAIWCAIAGGAEEVIIPEKTDIVNEDVINQVLVNRSKGKTHNLIVVAEGIGGSVELAKQIEEVTGITSRATILGYLQRGGSPTAVDRMHASQMGFKAVELIKNDKKNRVIAYRKGEYIDYDIEEALSIKGDFDIGLYDILKILAV